MKKSFLIRLYVIGILLILFFLSGCAYHDAMKRETDKTNTIHRQITEEDARKIQYERERDSLKAELNSLKAELSGLETEIARRQKEINALTRQASTLKGKNEQIRNRKQKEIESLKKQITDKKNAVASKEAELHKRSRY